MTIEIHQPELEALIAERMASGAFASVEELLLQAVKASPRSREPATKKTGLTGSVIVEAMQACPDPDFEFGEQRFPTRVRDPQF